MVASFFQISDWGKFDCSIRRLGNSSLVLSSDRMTIIAKLRLALDLRSLKKARNFAPIGALVFLAASQRFCGLARLIRSEWIEVWHRDDTSLVATTVPERFVAANEAETRISSFVLTYLKSTKDPQKAKENKEIRASVYLCLESLEPRRKRQLQSGQN